MSVGRPVQLQENLLFLLQYQWLVTFGIASGGVSSLVLGTSPTGGDSIEDDVVVASDFNLAVLFQTKLLGLFAAVFGLTLDETKLVELLVRQWPR